MYVRLGMGYPSVGTHGSKIQPTSPGKIDMGLPYPWVVYPLFGGQPYIFGSPDFGTSYLVMGSARMGQAGTWGLPASIDSQSVCFSITCQKFQSPDRYLIMPGPAGQCQEQVFRPD